MFNAAFSEGGPACTIKTVETLTDIRIDHYVVIDFTGFKDMVNALGGVKVCVPYDVQRPAVAPGPRGRHAHRQGPAGAGLRPHPARPRQRQRPLPDRPAAGVPRLDGHQGQGARACCCARTGCYNFLAAATNSMTTDPVSAASRRWPAWPRTCAASGHQGRHVRHGAERAVRRGPQPGAAGSSRRTRCGRSLRFDRPLPGKEPKPRRRRREPDRADRRWSRPPENIAVAGAQRLRRRRCGRAGSPRS